jgi:hypothetical protein
MKKIKLYGINTLEVNDFRMYTLNISINPSPIILNKIIEDPIWKDKHTLGMRCGKCKVNFSFVTFDENLFKAYTEKLYDILFAHKVNKLMNENPYVNRKKEIIVETLNKIDAEKNNCIL